MNLPAVSACLACRTCRGPVQAGFARCYQCDVAATEAAELLADVVVPTGYAVKGEPFGDDLRLYKSGRGGASESAERLQARLAEFLSDHGSCVWRAAGMPGGPTVAAIVPSGQGRAGSHPLAGIVGSCVALPLAGLSVAPGHGPRGRGLSLGWLRVRGRMAGEDVLLIDDCWVSGGSAQSAAATLKLAGAARVAIVVLGRHVDPADPRSAALLRALRSAPPLAGSCGLPRCGGLTQSPCKITPRMIFPSSRSW
jgi:hypothetical protein